jgi:biotin synthase
VIVGLGETEREVAEIIQGCFDMGVLPALFAFTPVRGTALESKSPPELNSYRRIQVARYLIVKGLGRFDGMEFDGEGKLLSFGLPDEALKSAIQSGEPFQTSGCQNCNRPFYNEKPSGPIYNYPIKPKKKEIEKIEQQLKGCLRD